ncbi:hypothetical protein BDY17DRAFT_194162 [Neohortaea acidophila]|uniref:Diphthine--ammonia ligase n=1 Tax=Neohortaea acidophila TaxID=245834 RepID=A0A6A6PKD6_9PEZI|nr:uncharacterized protein BDY17DRAFT_194162 [Neohortaea acidophila]KAF2480520.1 hypothetical protein BDY17DRAFT_194162 [Neohortaea acidophila]
MASLNVVGLISGGKDSFFSLLHCKKNGHNIVALANLHPPLGGKALIDDMDSYMYQTIGHAVVPRYAEALGLPLYRQEIGGSAVNADKCYGFIAENDETEALIPLLQKVKDNHPEVNAVSTGAILSDYQRTRVESVAVRLGLTPLSYLWQYPLLPPHTPTSLLLDMAAVGQDSRIIKVASGGLDVSFLWENVADLRTITRLEQAAKRFGTLNDGAVLGEGGEYETLAVDGPSWLWKRRLVVEDDDREALPGDAGSASVRVLSVRVESREDGREDFVEHLRSPVLLEPRFQGILDALLAETRPVPGTDSIVSDVLAGPVTPNHSGQPQAGHFMSSLTGKGSTVAQQMLSLMKGAKQSLHAKGCTFKNVTYTSIILRNMADFAAINPIYGQFFRFTNPPARATIACAAVLPLDKHVMVSFTVSEPAMSSARHGLHVQSRSYWAPANIGPYSQAISVPLDGGENGSLVYIAGQIPLVPASMEIVTPDQSYKRAAFSTQAVLALQHGVRVGRAMQVNQWACAVVFITAAKAKDAHSQHRIIRQVWEALHDEDSPAAAAEDPNFDVWDLKYGAARQEAYAPRHSLDEAGGSASSLSGFPDLFTVQVDALPRGADVEWVLFGLTAGGPSPRIAQVEQFSRLFEGRVLRGSLN